jgi:protein SCO1/2
MKRNLITLFITIAAALLLARVALYGPQQGKKAQIEPPAVLQNILLPEPRPLKPFVLNDHNSQSLGLEQLKGQWTFVFFGYTHCPDICPTTLGTLKGVANKLENQEEISGNTRFLFVSVDPKRDSLPYLKDYINYFHKEFVASTGERPEIDNLARQLGAIYMFEGDTERDDYIVNHSASVALIDPQGQWVARFNPPHTIKQLHSNYLQVRNYLKTTTPQD